MKLAHFIVLKGRNPFLEEEKEIQACFKEKIKEKSNEV
jgi:hypothetical protein